MSIFVLKVLALVTMVIDHTAAVLGDASLLPDDLVSVMRGIGRIAFPLYAFMLWEGFRHTRNRRKYALRLLGLGVLSQIPYAFTVNAWISEIDGLPAWQPMTDLNILFTLTLGVLLLALLDEGRLTAPLDSWGAVIACGVLAAMFYLSHIMPVALCFAAAFVLGLLSRFVPCFGYAGGQAARFALFMVFYWILRRYTPLGFDYDIYALLLFAALYWAKTPRRAAAVVAVWGLWCYSGAFMEIAFVAVAAICVALYNGQKGKNDHRLFYWAYPAHLLLIWGVVALMT